MNKLLLYGLLLVLPACNSKTEPIELELQKSKARLESEQKVNRVIEQLRADCDSTLLELAHQQADSIRLVNKKQKRQKLRR